MFFTTCHIEVIVYSISVGLSVNKIKYVLINNVYKTHTHNIVSVYRDHETQKMCQMRVCDINPFKSKLSVYLFFCTHYLKNIMCTNKHTHFYLFQWLYLGQQIHSFLL